MFLDFLNKILINKSDRGYQGQWIKCLPNYTSYEHKKMIIFEKKQEISTALIIV
jgi:hypothetical protein